MRNTRQRDAIKALFEREARPLSLDEVHCLGGAELGGLGLATVYKTLRCLQEVGFLRIVRLPGTVAHYEVAVLRHHHHFHCDECKKLFVVFGCPGDLQDMLPDGFRATAHDITLYGRCSGCLRPN